MWTGLQMAKAEAGNTPPSEPIFLNKVTIQVFKIAEEPHLQMGNCNAVPDIQFDGKSVFVDLKKKKI